MDFVMECVVSYLNCEIDEICIYNLEILVYIDVEF